MATPSKVEEVKNLAIISMVENLHCLHVYVPEKILHISTWVLCKYVGNTERDMCSSGE